MTFKHEFLTFPDITNTDTESGRFYTLPDGTEYPSVTTILSRADDGSGLEEWRKRVGREEADKIGRMAAGRGEKIHKMVELYLLNENNVTKGHMPINIEMFSTLKPYLNNVSEIYGIECPLYSHKLKAAGRSDLFAKYKDKKSIIDIKTSIRPKKSEWIEDYYLQTTTYKLMTDELFDFGVEQIVILIANQEGSCQEFIKDPLNYESDVYSLFRKYNV